MRALRVQHTALDPQRRIGWKAYRGAHVGIFGATALLAENYPYYSASGFIGLGGW
jgi:hypothetical protein